MSIFRVVKDKENLYVMINKEGLQDDRLSWKAKGLLAYLLTLPDDWQFYETEITRHSKDGRDSTRAGILELIKAGYIVREPIKNDAGQFKGYNYDIYEFSTVDGKSNNGKPNNGESNTTNNYLTDIYLTKNNDVPSVAESHIKYYLDKYEDNMGSKHPSLKKIQADKVKQFINSKVRELSLSNEDMQTIIDHHFIRSVNTDYNINHFATEGIFQNLVYTKCYYDK